MLRDDAPCDDLSVDNDVLHAIEERRQEEPQPHRDANDVLRVGEEGAEAPKRRMSDELADRHLSVIGNELAMDAALNWYRAAFGGGSTLARPDTPDVCVPTLYVWGDEDMSVGELAATRTGEHVSAEYRFERIAGAGHFLAEEVPEKVIPRLMEHLAANR